MSEAAAAGPSSFEVSNNMQHNPGSSVQSGSRIPNTGGADNLSVDIGAYLKGGSVNDFGLGGDVKTALALPEGIANQSVFAWADNATFAPFKLSVEPAIAPIESELAKANLTSVSLGEQTGAKIHGNTGLISQGGAER